MEDDNFFGRVHDVARQIPYGRVSTYGAIARHLGSAQSARMVGWAMNKAHAFNDIPAHRVVNRNGMLSGKHHFPGTDLMEQLLRNEGVEVIDDTVVNFKELLWEPMNELSHSKK